VKIGPGTGRAVHAQLSRLETELVAVAPAAPGGETAFALMAGAGTRVTVVSRLAVEAVRSFLVVHGLDRRGSRPSGTARVRIRGWKDSVRRSRG
jgi:hypothetical protein